ncbi:AraC family transcriptional regulator [Alkalihalobacillus oceani]|uniref:AraC family transcriptional regulator n=1 Tax=Halalkalibacter oceani TaxID=1653776 RepID=A0A9X2ILK7_9BACI|nr:AraC family transcriptional regulator [Halalkalibacter oceani]MCM3712969.1 AraC family transcriptional regulator [Halalkalibacter oceani]
MSTLSNKQNQYFLANLQVNLTVASFSHIIPSWKRINETDDFNRLYFIERGRGWMKVETEEIWATEGQMVVLPAQLPISYSTIDEQPFAKYWCHFTATLGNINLFQLVNVPYTLDVKDRGLMTEHFNQLIDWHSNTHFTAALRAKLLLTELICYYLEQSFREQEHLSLGPRSVSLEKINTVLTYIENHLSTSITVEELAELVHFHPNYFIKFFKSILGTSPIQYVNQIRLEKGKQMLISSDETITEIADRLGWDIYYFSRIFKRFTGLSPSEFRQLTRKNSN